ncbi:MAG: hypothetical protein QXW41_08040 [Fervidicoccaceae archaeon]
MVSVDYTDLIHVLFGFCVAVVRRFSVLVSAVAFSCFVAYEVATSKTKNELVEDLVEFLTGLVFGLIIY